jgi:hypothetical protein
MHDADDLRRRAAQADLSPADFWPAAALAELIRIAKTIASSARATGPETSAAYSVLAMARNNQPVPARLAQLVLWTAARVLQRRVARGWNCQPILFPCERCGVHVAFSYQRNGRDGWDPEALRLARAEGRG